MPSVNLLMQVHAIGLAAVDTQASLSSLKPHTAILPSRARFSGSAAVIPQVSAQHSVWVDVVADVVESKSPTLPPMGRLRSMFSFALIAFPNPVAITKRCVCLY